MKSTTLRTVVVQLAVKSGGAYNVSATRMKDIKVLVPPLAAQQKFVAKVETLEKQIAATQTVLDAAAAAERR